MADIAMALAIEDKATGGLGGSSSCWLLCDVVVFWVVAHGSRVRVA